MFFNSRQLRELIIRLKYVNCSLTEHRIVLSQAEQFDVLDLYKTRTQDELSLILFFLIDRKIHWSD